jgi:hypothetical protein
MAHIRYKGKSRVVIRLCELVNDLYERTFGDMTNEVYDQNDNGIVDNAERVNGHNVYKDVPADAQFTDTVYDDTLIRDRVSYLMNNTELIMNTLFTAEYNYLKDSTDNIIVDADGYPIYTARFYSALDELRTNIAELQQIANFLKSQKYVLWGDPEPEEEEE